MARRKTQQRARGSGRKANRGKSPRPQPQRRETKPLPGGQTAANDSSAVTGAAAGSDPNTEAARAVPSDVPGTEDGGVFANEPANRHHSRTLQADWDSEVEARFFSYQEELAPTLWDEELAASEEPASAAEPLTREQLARRALCRRVVSRTVAALGVFAIGSVVARVAFGV